MTDIIRASIYRLKISKLHLYSGAVALGLGLMFCFLSKSNLAYDVSYTSIYEIIRGNIDSWVFFGFVIVMVLIVSYIGNDFKDKTIYYEVMGGHSRREVLLGRVIASGGLAWLVWTMMGCLLLCSCKEEYTILFDEGWQLPFRVMLAVILLMPYIGVCILGAFMGRDVLKGLILTWSFYLIIQMENILIGLNNLQEDVVKYFIVKRIEYVILHPISAGFISSILVISILETFILMVLANTYFDKIELR